MLAEKKEARVSLSPRLLPPFRRCQSVFPAAVISPLPSPLPSCSIWLAATEPSGCLTPSTLADPVIKSVHRCRFVVAHLDFRRWPNRYSDGTGRIVRHEREVRRSRATIQGFDAPVGFGPVLMHFDPGSIHAAIGLGHALNTNLCAQRNICAGAGSSGYRNHPD